MATLVELQQRKAAYLASEARILESQDYSIGDGVITRRNRRADLEQVRLQIAELDRQIAAHPDTRAATASTSRRVRYIR